MHSKCSNLSSVEQCRLIDTYYDSVISALKATCQYILPTKIVHCNDGAYCVPGWNDYVKDKHEYAREMFVKWLNCGKPHYGPEYELMRRARANFKLALRYCKRNIETMRADAYASNLSDKEFDKFWKSVNKASNSKSTAFATTVGGHTGERDIAEMWHDHFQTLYNSLDTTDDKKVFYEELQRQQNNSQPHLQLTVDNIVAALSKQKRNKAAGPDGLSMEAFMYGGLRLNVHLCFIFNLFLEYTYMPKAFMESIFVPLVKCKSGDLTDVNNYRAVSLSNAISKIFESAIVNDLDVDKDIDYNQFGFKHGHSTTLCTNVLKTTIDYFVNRGSHVFTCFVDFSKAFDRVNYWKLFKMLIEDGVNLNTVGTLAYWYSNQQARVRWHNHTSVPLNIGNGTRQGGVLSPKLFVRYIRDVLVKLRESKPGCMVGGLMINVLAYADDIVLCAPTWRGLQHLLNILAVDIANIDMSCNVNKTVCMVFNPKDCSMSIDSIFPNFMFGTDKLLFVNIFKYLGHNIANDTTDDTDVNRETKCMYTRVNILMRKFSHCSKEVKTVLFKSFCICLYGNALWRHYSVAALDKLRSCYTKCIKLFFGYNRRCSVTLMLLQLSLPSFNTLMHNSRILFSRLWRNTNNFIVCHLCSIGVQ